jgi:excisionase family DNA binding protein
MSNEMLYTVSEVAKLLKVNRTFVYDLIKTGQLPAVKIGSLKVRRETLEKFLEVREHG